MLLPCFVSQEKTDVKPAIPPTLEEGRDANLSALQDRYGVLNIDAESKLKFGWVEVTMSWPKAWYVFSSS